MIEVDNDEEVGPPPAKKPKQDVDDVDLARQLHVSLKSQHVLSL